MDRVLADLLKLLELERIEINLFRGESRDIGSPQVFGGQVLGQALVAASMTVENRCVHSLHAYFLRPGDFNHPIVYEVDRSRDGHSFTTRRVVAIQHGRQIFHLSASFQIDEEGFSHQVPMPAVPPPEKLKDTVTWSREIMHRIPEKMRRFYEHQRPFEFRPVRLHDPSDPTPDEPIKRVWFRAVDRVPDGEALHRCLLAYVSDYHLLDTATLPHGISYANSDLQMASLDHAMWFHRPVRVDDWLLYSIESPSASGARGLARGHVFDRTGRLVASTAQEGLIRLRSRGLPSPRPSP
ncbi:MAG TPA: acyl-CoA thioesterase II, partial [Steroidobacteraceae bacterium]|nr:acyl-CoA thioesterase II [Steroidobacteraceae bacterium]